MRRFQRRRPSVFVHDDGPGGPVLVVVGAGFDRYLAEILRAEGLSSFRVIDDHALTSDVLDSHDVTIIGANARPDLDVVDAWLDAGGSIVALRPGTALAAAAASGPRATWCTRDTCWWTRRSHRGVAALTDRSASTATLTSSRRSTPTWSRRSSTTSGQQLGIRRSR